MELVGVRLTTQTIQHIDNLVKAGIYPNRSEVLRDATRLLLRLHKRVEESRVNSAAEIKCEKIIEDYAKKLGFEL